MRAQVYSERFRRGLQTTQQPDGADRIDGFRRFHGISTQTGDAVRTLGKVRLGRVDLDQQSQVFDGVDQKVVSWMGTDVWDLDRGEWTLEMLVKTASGGGGLAETILTVGSTTPVLEVERTGTSVAIHLHYFDATQLTINVGPLAEDAKGAIQVERMGPTVRTRLNGALADTSTLTKALVTPVGDLWVGDGPQNPYLGSVDYIRLLDFTKGHHRDRWARLLNPRGARVLFDMIFPADGNDTVWERSRHERHGKFQGTAASTTEASIAWQDAPIQTLAPYRDNDQERRVLVVAAGHEYDARL